MHTLSQVLGRYAYQLPNKIVFISMWLYRLLSFQLRSLVGRCFIITINTFRYSDVYVVLQKVRIFQLLRHNGYNPMIGQTSTICP